MFGSGLLDLAESNSDRGMQCAANVNPAAFLEIWCGHRLQQRRTTYRSLRRHYPHQVQRVPREIPRISAKGSPAKREAGPVMTWKQGDCWGVRSARWRGAALSGGSSMGWQQAAPANDPAFC